MNKNHTVGVILEAVESVKKDGHEFIETSSLIEYLTALEADGTIEELSSGIAIENLKHSNQTQLEIYKTMNAFQIESFKSVITVGANACRAFMVMNGAAAIALLAFLGNIWEKQSVPSAANGVAYSLLLFALGVLASGLCSAATYLAQSGFSYSVMGENKGWQLAGLIFNVLSCFFGATSLILFAYGSCEAFMAMQNQLLKPLP